MTIDTLSAAKALRNSGLSETSAEAIVMVVQQAAQMDHLVTKEDLNEALEKSETRMKLFVATTVIGSAAAIVLAQTLTKVIGLTP